MEIKCEECGVFNSMEDTHFTTTGFKGICKKRADCKTRQRLIATIRRRSMSDNDQFHNKAKILTSVDFNRSELALAGLRSKRDDFYVVWFAKVLGNWKAMVSTDLVDDQYWEVTYNGEKKEAYVDHYSKVSNHKYVDFLDESISEGRERRDRFRRETNQATVAKVQELHDAKVTNADIALQLGIDELTVHTLLKTQ